MTSIDFEKKLHPFFTGLQTTSLKMRAYSDCDKIREGRSLEYKDVIQLSEDCMDNVCIRISDIIGNTNASVFSRIHEFYSCFGIELSSEQIKQIEEQINIEW